MPSLFCLWSLLAFYHDTNNLIMMGPAFVFVWFLDERSRPAAAVGADRGLCRPR